VGGVKRDLLIMGRYLGIKFRKVRTALKNWNNRRKRRRGFLNGWIYLNKVRTNGLNIWIISSCFNFKELGAEFHESAISELARART
jgi:hypothetical protein